MAGEAYTFRLCWPDATGIVVHFMLDLMLRPWPIVIVLPYLQSRCRVDAATHCPLAASCPFYSDPAVHMNNWRIVLSRVQQRIVLKLASFLVSLIYPVMAPVFTVFCKVDPVALTVPYVF